MIAFEIQIDDAAPVVTGVEDWRVLTFTLAAGRRATVCGDEGVPHDLHIHAGGVAGGVTPDDGEHVRWPLPPVAVGSRVSVRILDIADPDPPAQRHRPDDDEEHRATLASDTFKARRHREYLKLKAEFEPDRP